MIGTLLVNTSHLSRFEVGVDQLLSQTVQFLPFPPFYFSYNFTDTYLGSFPFFKVTLNTPGNMDGSVTVMLNGIEVYR